MRKTRERIDEEFEYGHYFLVNSGYLSHHVPEITLPLIIKCLIKCLIGINCDVGDLMEQRVQEDTEENGTKFFVLMSKIRHQLS